MVVKTINILLLYIKLTFVNIEATTIGTEKIKNVNLSKIDTGATLDEDWYDGFNINN